MQRLLCVCGLLLAVLVAACDDEPRPTAAAAAAAAATSPASPTNSETVNTAPEVTAEETEAPAAKELSEPTADVDSGVGATDSEARKSEREMMVTEGVIGWGVRDETVHEAMKSVPRHEFVPEEYAPMAYENHPLPIGYGQTISQPYIVGLMTEAIEPSNEFRVLEIGTGSGYQAAILAELVDQVYSVEIIEPLHERAKETLRILGYDNVSLLQADGYFGWEEQAPFDAIVVTAAPDHVPQPLVQQLKIGGKMIIPVGPVGGFQNLWLISRVSEDQVETKDLGGVSFVPFTREEG